MPAITLNSAALAAEGGGRYEIDWVGQHRQCGSDDLAECFGEMRQCVGEGPGQNVFQGGDDGGECV